MNRKVAMVAVLVVAVAAGAGAWSARSAPAPGLRAAGTIESREARLGSLVGGRVATVLVDEGARVRAGQPLVTLEAALLEPQLREQEGRLREVKAHLDLLRAGPRVEEIARARAEWHKAEADRRRAEALAAQGVIGRQAYEAAVVEATTRGERVKELEHGSRPEEVAAAEAAVERERGRLAWLRQQREETVVRAPFDGLVQSVGVRPGDVVTAGQPVADLLEPDQVWARVFVPEPSLGRVRLGAAVTLTVDSHPGRAFGGRVGEISPRAEYTPRNVQTLEQRADQVFGVKVLIDPAPELRPGMAVLATLAAE